MWTLTNRDLLITCLMLHKITYLQSPRENFSDLPLPQEETPLHPVSPNSSKLFFFLSNWLQTIFEKILFTTNCNWHIWLHFFAHIICDLRSSLKFQDWWFIYRGEFVLRITMRLCGEEKKNKSSRFLIVLFCSFFKIVMTLRDVDKSFVT